MRRAVALAVLVGAAPVGAAPWVVTGEAGAELDSNVQRVESSSDPNADKPTTAWVMRVGARVDRKGKAAGGTFLFNLSDLTRIVPAGGKLVNENIALLAGNVRWLHQIGERPVAAGFALTATDALPLSDDIVARTYRNLGADAVLAMRSEDDHELTLSFGARDFVYPPGHRMGELDIDWRGPVAAVRLELMLWQPPAKTKSLELVTSLAFESRTFETGTLTFSCPPGQVPTMKDPCVASTPILRRDRYQRIGTELTWVGHQVAALGYQLTVIDSNYYGQSLARHRVTASGTAALPYDVYGTLLAILQIDQYLDGRLLGLDPQMQDYISIDDENRSSVQVRLARKLVGEWALEGRAAIWRNLTTDSTQPDFQRELVYLGLVYGR